MSPRDSAFGLTPSGPAQALFKTVNRFVLQLELFRVYACIIFIARLFIFII
jgi:hypothetical protein